MQTSIETFCFWFSFYKLSITLEPMRPVPGGPTGPAGPGKPLSPFGKKTGVLLKICSDHVHVNKSQYYLGANIIVNTKWFSVLQYFHVFTFGPGKPIPSGPGSPGRPGDPGTP